MCATRVRPDPKLLIFFLALLSFAYFYQGGGWSQNVVFCTVRSLVEHASFDISFCAEVSGDTVYVNGRTYSNKAPGFAVFLAPAYFALYHLEQLFGADPTVDYMQDLNAYLLSILGSGLPSACIIVLVYSLLLRFRLPNWQATLFAAIMTYASLLLPYSGALERQNLLAFLHVYSISLLLEERPSSFRLFLAGLSQALAFFTDYATVAVLPILLTLSYRQFGARSFLLLGGWLPGVVGALFNNYTLFGSISATAFAWDRTFVTPGLWFGVFAPPSLSTLLNLTIHPYKGLLFTMPLSCLLIFSSGGLSGRMRTASVLVCLWYLTFFAAFNGWHGGACYGPRYLIPILPLVFLLSWPSLVTLSRPRLLICAWSAVLMFVVTATGTFIPYTPIVGGPPFAAAIGLNFSLLLSGKVSVNSQSIREGNWTRDGAELASGPDDRWDSFNLGELLGLEGVYSLLPFLVLPISFLILIRRMSLETGLSGFTIPPAGR